jgi:two-component SAPR family response regulator
MIAIAVDDEHPMLQALAEAVEASPDIRQLYTFSSCSSALKWMESNAVDVAFLDISMRGMGGLALAEKIGQLQPSCKIVFCTGYEQYALDAIQLRCSGYLMKPITAQAVQKELDHIKKQPVNDKKLTVKCFGSFEVLSNGQTLTFKRTKAKELLAVLIDRNGAGMTGKQICAVLWPEDSDDTKNMDYCRHLMQDLRNTLDGVGAGSVLCQEGYQYRVDPSQISCDYHSYLQYGSPAFYGEYMTQYSWAEDTCGLLQK